MLKRTLIMLVLVGGFSMAAPTDANAWVVRRIAPVRRIAARAVLPPYPVARRAVVAPIYRRPVVYGRPVIYAAPQVYVRPVVRYGYYGY